MVFRVVGGYTEGLVWMLLAFRETTETTNCSAVRGRNFFQTGEMNDVTSKLILFLYHRRAVPYMPFSNLRRPCVQRQC